MDTIGLDLHKRESQLCIGRDDGSVEERRIVTSRERFTAVLGDRPRARILLEASTESEWVTRHLESLGHEVIVADPNFAPMYATRARRTKTDRRDARTLMDACRLGAYRPAYRLSDARRHVRAELAVRKALVRTRRCYIALAKALVRRDGLRVAASEAHLAPKRIAALEISDGFAGDLLPLFEVLAPINEQIAAADRRLIALASGDGDMALLDEYRRLTHIAIMTQGPRGCMVYVDGQATQVPGFPVQEIDPTGAGDVFAAAFLIRLEETRDPIEAARFANATASFCVQGPGVTTILTRAPATGRPSRSRTTPRTVGVRIRATLRVSPSSTVTNRVCPSYA